MCSDSCSQLSSIEAARVDTPWMPTRPKIIFGVLFAASWLGTLLLEFSFPRLSDWMPLVFFLSGFILLFLTVVDLAFRRWKQLASALVIWAIALYPIYGYGAPIKWLYGVAFRIHASPLDEYLSGCRLIEFTENGVRQKLGECEAHGQSFRVLVVFYDSTGEFALPLSQRSAEWKKAMGCFSPAKYFTEEDWPATRIWENYYVIHILLNDLDGAGDNC